MADKNELSRKGSARAPQKARSDRKERDSSAANESKPHADTLYVVRLELKTAESPYFTSNGCLYFILGNFLISPVIELRRADICVTGHVLRIFKRAAVLEIRGYASTSHR